MHSLLGWGPSRWRRCHILLIDARVCLCRFVVIEKRRLAVGINSWWHAWVRSYAWPWWWLWSRSRPVSFLVSSFCVRLAAGVSCCLLAPRHGVFRLSKSDIFRAQFLFLFPNCFFLKTNHFLSCHNMLNNDAPIALCYLY